ncbi:uncharacterized protein LOC128739269 [Sabethes cyaneus]|uniref:uncharacterized protein LOC128739269 n=1 Tax=Sabethes cyaneus TaxID=53552 RepID=UPI00237E6CB2|nr:uncharacterized protein LOC128739269 [Sabethes cyaneus]
MSSNELQGEVNYLLPVWHSDNAPINEYYRLFYSSSMATGLMCTLHHSASFANNPELNDHIGGQIKPSHYVERFDPRNPELCDSFSNYRELTKKDKKKQYDASKYNDFHELQADFKELRTKGKRKDDPMMHKGNRKKKKKKFNFEGETFKDPDPYQLAVRKTQYGKQKSKFVFEGETFKDPDPFELAIKKGSSSRVQNDKDIRQEFMKQLHHAHPGLVHGNSDISKEMYIGNLDGDDDDGYDDDEAPCLNRSALAQFLAVGVKNVLLLGYGMTLGFPTIVIPAIQGGDGRVPSYEKDFVLSRDQISWLSSINLICVPLGCVFSGMLTQPIGRRRAMQIVNIPMLIAWLLFHFADDVHFLYCGLALAGFSGGLSEAPVLTYVSEITQPRYRGMLAATGSTCVIIGVLIQFLMGSFLRWRTVALWSACVPIISFLLLFFVPESPVWLAGKGRYKHAQRALAWLRGWVSEEEVETEFSEIRKHMQESIEHNKDYTLAQKIKKYGSRSFIQPFCVISLCFFIGHFSGMTTLQTYAVQIFHTLKAPIDKYYATILLGVSELLGTLFCVCLVHFSGKRPLVFVSTVGCAICFFSVAFYAYFLSSIPGSTVNNIVANVSAIRTDIRVIPLNHTTVITVIPETNDTIIDALNETMNTLLNKSSDAVYDHQSFTPYYLNGSYDDALNSSIHYGEYVKSAIPSDVLVKIPNTNENKFLWIPLTLLLASAFLTHMGIRLIPWMLIGELFAPAIRSGASGIAGGTGYIFGFLANKLFLWMLSTFSLPGTFCIYSAIAIVGAIILYRVLPETEGKSLVEIETYFMSKRKRSIHFELECGPPLPKPRGTATAFAPPPPLPPRSHPLKDDLGRIRKISQQFGAQSRKNSTSSTPRKISQVSISASEASRKISIASSKGSLHSYDLSSSHPSQIPDEHYRKVSTSQLPPPLPTISASPEPNRKLPIPQSNSVAITEKPSKQTTPKVPTLVVTPQKVPIKSKSKKSRKPSSSLKNFDINNWDSNRKFEEFLMRRRKERNDDPDELADNGEAEEGHPRATTASQHELNSFEQLTNHHQQQQHRDSQLLSIGMQRHRQNSGSLNALTSIGGYDNRAYTAGGSSHSSNETRM